jgi:hypothetical protein
MVCLSRNVQLRFSKYTSCAPQPIVLRMYKCRTGWITKILQNSLISRPYRGYEGLWQTKGHKWLTLASQRRGHPGNPFGFVNGRQGFFSFATSHSSSVPPHPFITAFWWATDPTDHLATTPSVLNSLTPSKHTVSTFYITCPRGNKRKLQHKIHGLHTLYLAQQVSPAPMHSTNTQRGKLMWNHSFLTSY